MTLHELYLRVMMAVEPAHPSIKAEVDSAFAAHAAEAAAGDPVADLAPTAGPVPGDQS